MCKECVEQENVKPRAKTKHEVQKEFIPYIKNIAKYWAELDGKTDIEKCDGTAFSILTLLDGFDGFTAVDLVLSPHPDDKDYCIKKGENWYKSGIIFNDNIMLHDLFYM